MKQLQVIRPKRRAILDDVDLRTPSGRQLPF